MKKRSGAEVENSNLKTWCEHCSIRIAPNEVRVNSDGKIYHQHCHEKCFPAGSKVAAALSRKR
jgi:hypothetical protein